MRIVLLNYVWFMINGRLMQKKWGDYSGFSGIVCQELSMIDELLKGHIITHCEGF